MIYGYIIAGALGLVALCLLAQKYMNLLVERKIAAYQNDLVARHCAEVENIYRQMRSWRHDYHNHIQAMQAFLTLDQTAKLKEYLGKLDGDLTQVDTILKTGNVMVDAILNSKISLARTKSISVNAQASVSGALPVQDVELCVILGNLIDNAIEACARLSKEDERFIRIYLGLHKAMFYISVSNATGGEVKKVGGRYLSTKHSPSHGFGLVRVDKIVEKYGGFVNRQNEPGVFATEIMLPPP